MDKLSGPPQATELRKPEAAVRLSLTIRPRSWFGKLVATIVGATLTLAALFLSVIVFAIVASLVVAAVIYFLWSTRHARGGFRARAEGDDIIDHDPR